MQAAVHLVQLRPEDCQTMFESDQSGVEHSRVYTGAQIKPRVVRIEAFGNSLLVFSSILNKENVLHCS